MEVKVINGDLNKALKILKKKIQNSGLMTELRNRKYAEKPSVRKRRKQREAERRRNKMLKRNNVYNNNNRGQDFETK